MAMQNLLKKPIMVGGLGICLFLGGWEYLNGGEEGINQWVLWGLSGLGLLTWRLRRSPQDSPGKNIDPLTPETVAGAIAEVDQHLSSLESQTPGLELTDLRRQLMDITIAVTPPEVINGVILGEKRTGKSSLLALLPTQGTFADSGEAFSLNWQAIPAEIPRPQLEALTGSAHFIWVLTNADLTATQWQLLEFLRHNHHHWQLVLNKQDLYSDGDRQGILAQLQCQITSLEPDHPVEGISAAPQPIQIRRHLADGRIETDQEMVPPHLGNLLSQVNQINSSVAQTWHLGVQWRQVQAIQHQARRCWQGNRRALALPMIEQAQWLTAGTALVNPLANLDLLAAIAINGQLVFDLSRLYHQSMSLAQAKTVATQIGEILIKLGLVELSTQALAELLKSQPLTYLAGGAIQGLSAAYLTRIAGLGLVAFLENQPLEVSVNQWDWHQLTNVIKQTFDQNQRLNVLSEFWQAARCQLPALAAVRGL